MVGSRAYTVAHRAELDKTAGVVVFDSGIGRVTGFSLGGRRDVVNTATTLVAPLKSLDASTLTTDADWGTDNFDFLLQGSQLLWPTRKRPTTCSTITPCPTLSTRSIWPSSGNMWSRPVP